MLANLNVGHLIVSIAVVVLIIAGVVTWIRWIVGRSKKNDSQRKP